ncbi:Hypothetical predicted protein [Podarcis lilfordi]|uniref:Uncharacterized protein n=1 Tax=Podarcis lilfordi TaxID=74358 RepID=A0AA35LFN1_9SAUR|nr:Hypothetical predicted protein [Podarcis lilfordi]
MTVGISSFLGYASPSGNIICLQLEISNWNLLLQPHHVMVHQLGLNEQVPLYSYSWAVDGQFSLLGVSVQLKWMKQEWRVKEVDNAWKENQNAQTDNYTTLLSEVFIRQL